MVMKKLFYQLWVVVGMALTILSLTEACCTNCSSYERSYEKVLTRQKRFLIFNKGGNVIHTSYFGKQIVAGFPRGFNWILELDMFYPLPFEPRVFSQAKDLLFGKNHVKPNIPPWLIEPKKPSYSTVVPFYNPPPPKPLPPITPIEPIEHFDPHLEHFDPHIEHEKTPEIWSPPSGWKDDVLANIKHQEKLKRKSWNRNWVNAIPSNQFYKPRGRSMTDNNIISSRWENIYAQKDRQDLYEIIHAGFKKVGIDTTACLQRTICEAKHFLLPQGKSLLHDVFRLVFSYPLHLDDKWSSAARSTHQDDCIKEYSKECPMSILDFMLHSGNIF